MTIRSGHLFALCLGLALMFLGMAAAYESGRRSQAEKVAAVEALGPAVNLVLSTYEEYVAEVTSTERAFDRFFGWPVTEWIRSGHVVLASNAVCTAD